MKSEVIVPEYNSTGVKLFYVADVLEDAAPTDAGGFGVGVFAYAEPDKERFTNDVVFWHKSPIAGVC